MRKRTDLHWAIMFREADYDHLMVADSEKDLIEKVKWLFNQQYGEDEVEFAQMKMKEESVHDLNEDEISYWESLRFWFDDNMIMDVYYPDQIS